VEPKELTEIKSLAGAAVPNLAFVYVNYNDHAFAKVGVEVCLACVACALTFE
jgi:hypothetical protein